MKTTCNKKTPLRPAGGSLQSPVSSEYPLKKALDSYKYLLLLVCLTMLIACQCPTDPTRKEDIPATNIVIEQGNFTTSNNTSAINGTLSATVIPTNHTDGEITINWASSDEDMLSVQSNSNTTASYEAIFDGSNINEAVIVSAWVSGKPHLSNSIEITLYHLAATNIVLDQADFTITNNTAAVNGTLSATVYPTDHTDGEIIINWASSDEDRLSIQSNSNTTASYGASFDGSNISDVVTVHAWVSGEPHLSNSIEITLYHLAATNIVLEQADFTITNNTAATNGTLSATVSPTDHTDGEILWTSSDERLSVSGNNTTASYVALFDGRDINEVVTVSAWVSGRPQLSNSIEITLYHRAATNIVLDREDFSIGEGDELSGTLTATFAPADSSVSMGWSSDSPQVLTLSGSGNTVTYEARGGGEAVVSVSAGSLTTNITVEVADWISVGNAQWTNRRLHSAVVFDDKMWVLGGIISIIDNSTHFNDVWWSTNGKDWTQATADAPWPNRGAHSVVTYSNKMYLMGGNDGSTRYNDVWFSSDGTNWTPATANAPWTNRSAHSVVTYSNKMYLMGGNDGSTRYNDVWFSSDGTDWTQASASNDWVARSGHASVVFDDKMWVLGGYDGSSFLNDGWCSGDGTNWSNIDNASERWRGRLNHTSAVYNGRIYIIGGAYFDSVDIRGLNDVWYSSDGVDWNQATNARWSSRISHATVVYDNKIWVMGGDVNEKNDVWFYWGDD